MGEEQNDEDKRWKENDRGLRKDIQERRKGTKRSLKRKKGLKIRKRKGKARGRRSYPRIFVS